ncbi:hypothetical protein TUMEXPCC7403_03700 [Tumidithrix helvetica PCC 7403]|uniref:hypothetical protein n=1 Tax=Tumidithrix helvetica TaxID=3457545 RepID=UPI003C9FEDE9
MAQAVQLYISHFIISFYLVIPIGIGIATDGDLSSALHKIFQQSGDAALLKMG